MNSGKEFEEKVADCYRKLGYDVKPNQNLCGFQIDLVIEKRGGGFLNQAIVECKDKQRIGNKDRDQILAQQNVIHKQYPAYRWIVVSSHGITPDAKTAFKAAGVVFVRYADLLEDVLKYMTNSAAKPEITPIVSNKQKQKAPDSRKIPTDIFDKTEQLKLEQSSTPEISKPQRLPIVQREIGRNDTIRAVAYSPDGKLIACGGDDFVMLYRLSDNKIMQIFDEHKGSVNSVCFSPSGKLLASAGEDSTISLRDLKTSKTFQILSGHTASVSSVVFSSNGNSLASGSDDKTIRLWDLTGKTLHVLEGHSEDVTSVDFSPDGNRLISGSKDKTICLWNVKEGKFICKMKSNRQLDVVRSVKFSPCGTRIVSAGKDNKVILWDTVDAKSLYILKDGWEEDYETTSVCFSPDGKRVVSGGENGLRLWDAENNQKLIEHRKDKWTNAVSFSPDGNYVIAVNHGISLWNLEKNIFDKFPEYRKSITPVDFSDDGNLIAFGCDNNKLVLWDVKLSKLLRIFTFKNLIRFTDRIYFSPNKKFIMGGKLVWNVETGKLAFSDKRIWIFSSNGKYICSDGSYPLNIYDIENEKLVSSIKGKDDFFNVSFSPDGKYILIDSDEIIKLFEVEKEKLLYTVEAGFGLDSSIFSPDASCFAAEIGRKYQKLCVWNAKDGKLLCVVELKYERLEEYSYGIRFRFSPDSKRIITWSDHTLQIWDIKTGKCLHELHGHTNLINSMDFSPDGKYIATGSSDHTVRIWDTETGKCLNVSEGHSGRVYTVRFAPNGKYLIAAGEAGRLQFVDHQTGKTFLYRYVFGKDAWLDLLPDGRFDASPEGMKYLSYTETEEDNQGTLQFKSYNAEELKDEFHQPQAVKDVLDKYQKI